MSIARYIRDIGRGKDGARSLDRAQAEDLMGQVLDGRVSDLEIGAFAIAMRIKGESVAELCGFLDAVHARCIPIRSRAPTVLLPSYNGARKLPNLTALLALLLAQQGVQVLVHGMPSDPQRVTTHEVFRDLGLPCALDALDIEHAWARREPVFITTEALCPPLARLLEVRRVIGLRNPGHTVAKLLAPLQHAAVLRVVNHTHPEYAGVLSDFLMTSRANAVLMRGTEGEPVADPRRLPRMDATIDGQPRPDLSLPAQAGVLTELPVLPRSIDAPTTAVYIQSVVSGETPAPGPVTKQVDCLLRVLAACLPAPVEQTA
ncbi:MAG: DNA-binding protein YbiB [Burkholderiaceae bacterium]